MATNKIYHLERNNIPFYIGKTMVPNRRLSNHKKTYGSDIEMVVIDEGENYGELENQWINHYTQLGYKLKNKSKGGGGRPSIPKTAKALVNKAIKEIDRELDFININWNINNNIQVVEKSLQKNGYELTYNKIFFSIVDRIYKEYINGGTKITK